MDVVNLKDVICRSSVIATRISSTLPALDALPALYRARTIPAKVSSKPTATK